MKFTTRLLVYWVSIFLAFLIGIMLIIGLLWGIQINPWKLLLAFVIVGVIPPAIITAYFYKRLDYMESDDTNPPVFTGQKKAALKFSGRTSNAFDEVMQRIDRQWIISYSDRENNILKFRTDSRMIAWGIGGYVKMENEKTVQVIVYPVFPNSRREEKVMNQTLRLMQSVLNP